MIKQKKDNKRPKQPNRRMKDFANDMVELSDKDLSQVTGGAASMCW
jgi:bacteriocin-like protein